jgi:hypothetical protein
MLLMLFKSPAAMALVVAATERMFQGYYELQVL